MPFLNGLFIFCQVLIHVNPQDAMAVSRTPKLELNSPGVVTDMHWSKLIHDDILDKHLKSVLEVSCCSQGVLPDEFMLSFMMTKKLLNSLSIYPAPLNPIFYDI